MHIHPAALKQYINSHLRHASGREHGSPGQEIVNLEIDCVGVSQQIREGPCEPPTPGRAQVQLRDAPHGRAVEVHALRRAFPPAVLAAHR